MNLNLLEKTDLFGRLFLKASSRGAFIGYYRSLDAVRPLVESEDWQKSVTGFFINTRPKHLDAVRISYFTPYPDTIKQIVDRLTSKHGLEVIESEDPHETILTQTYGGEELRFRRLLSTYTLIGLDVMSADIFNAQCLFMAFRWQITRARKACKPYFLQTFESQSPFYKSLSQSEKDQLWFDLDYWPNSSQFDWAHFFVNMVLCNDPLGEFFQEFSSPKPPLTIPEINKKSMIKPPGLQIPENWHP